MSFLARRWNERASDRAMILALALLPSALTLAVLGRVHPDEVFQMLEPAFVRAHGYGMLSWEWRAGLRNWALPGLFAAILRGCDALGVDHPLACRAAIALPLVGLHALALASVRAYALRRSAGPAARLATMLFGLAGPVLMYAGRTLSESISMAFVVMAVDRLDRTDGRDRDATLSGIALGLGVVARYGSLVLVPIALAWLLGRRRARSVVAFVLGFAAVAFALGALDRITWGHWFGSLVAYVRFNVLGDRAAVLFGASPPRFYVRPLLQSLPAWVWLATWVARSRWRSPSLPGVMAVAYLAVIALTPHKEGRFLYPTLVLAVMASAPVMAGWMAGGAPRWAVTAALAAGAVPMVLQPSLHGDLFRATVRVAREPDTRGVLIVGDPPWSTGGSFHVGTGIPWRAVERAGAVRAIVSDRRFNRAVARGDDAVQALELAGFRAVGVVGSETLLARP